jgi:hypothetical protein
MKNLISFSKLIGLLISLFLLLPGIESKAQLKKMSEKDLTDESTAVLYGKCSKIKAEWNETKDMIFTSVTIVPEGYLKGNLGADAVLSIPGGQIGDIIYEVSEMPVFTEGEEVVAFVWKHPSGKNLVTGGSQGKLKIEKDALTGKRIVKGKIDDSQGDSEDLESFVEKVKGYVKN